MVRLANSLSVVMSQPGLIDSLGFNGTFSTVRLYRAFDHHSQESHLVDVRGRMERNRLFMLLVDDAVPRPLGVYRFSGGC